MKTAQTKSPAWLRKLLSLFLESRTLEACLGDLEEKFAGRIKRGPAWRARLLYVTEGIGFLRLMKRPSPTQQSAFDLLQHSVKFLSRLARRDRSYYFVSLFGLSLSLASLILISLFVYDESSYDTFHVRKDRLFRLVTHIRIGDVEYNEATSQFPAAPAVKSEIPGIIEVTRVFPQTLTFERGDKKFPEHFIFADDNFFRVFSFPLLSGDPDRLLGKPTNVVLTEASARRFFGNEDPLGKTLTAAGQELVVSGVLRDVPQQSHLKFTMVIPLSLQLSRWKDQTGIEGRENKWFWTGAYTYVLLENQDAAPGVRAALPAIINKYFPERYKSGGSFELQPIGEIHLRSHLSEELEPPGSILYVRLFSIVALVIMIVCSINLINLSYFKISRRIREVAIRKFLGQPSMRIVLQLAMESLFLGSIAFVLALVFSQTAITPFNVLVQKNLSLWTLPNLQILAITFLLVLVISLVSVARPAWRYATQSASFLLLQNYRDPARGRLRNLLIGLQVGFSFVLLVFSFIISGQIDFFRTKDLGFDKSNVVVVRLNQDVFKSLEAFRSEVLKDKDVQDVAGGSVPGEGYDGWRFVPEGGSYEKPFMFPYASVDYHFLKTLRIKILTGRDFDPSETYDSLIPFMINKRAAGELGWRDDPVGKTLALFAPGTENIMAKGRIIALIDDYHFESLHNPVKPVVLTVRPKFGTALIKLNGPVNSETTARFATIWKKFSDDPFVFEMMERKLERLYAGETQLSRVILFFTAIALYLTCYGLFAMSSLLFSSRLKEVAIRKVFGANQGDIVRQLYSKYAFFNLVAICAGLPAAIYFGHAWLETFQYRIDLGISLFVKAAAWIFAAGLLSVSYYLAQAAWSNPVKFLRRE